MDISAKHKQADSVAEAIRSIQAEVEVERERKCTLDKDAIRANREELFGLVQEGQGKLDRDAPPKLPGYTAALRQGFEQLDGAIEEHGGAPGGQQRYSAEAREAAKAAHEVEIGLRRLLAERAGDTAIARELKSEAGVGEPLDVNAPMEVHDLGLRQIAALSKEAYQKLLAGRDLDHGRKLKQLVAVIGELKRQLDAGVGRGPKKGETSDAINTALVWLEVTFSRVISYLDEYGARDVADRLRKRVPRRHARRRTDPGTAGGASGDVGQGAGAAGGEGAGGKN